MNILVIAPHHDDEVIGCGGTLIKHYKKGDKIWVAYIAAGWSGVPKIKSKKRAIEIREEEARNSAKILGINKVVFLREDDRNYSLNKGTLEKLIKIIREFKPRLIYAPHPNETDFEHRMAYQMAKEAFWISQSSYFPNLGKLFDDPKSLYLYEVWTPISNPAIREDITEVIDKKILALKEYRSQLNDANLVDAVYGLNLYRGSMFVNSKKFAEAFQVEKA